MLIKRRCILTTIALLISAARLHACDQESRLTIVAQDSANFAFQKWTASTNPDSWYNQAKKSVKDGRKTADTAARELTKDSQTEILARISCLDLIIPQEFRLPIQQSAIANLNELYLADLQKYERKEWHG